MAKILLITPPFVQPNTAYPATAYLKGFLGRRDIDAEQFDMSVELLNKVFSSGFLAEVFELYASQNEAGGDEAEAANLERIYTLRESYLSTIDTVMAFLRGEDPTLANLISMPDFIPQAGRFEYIADLGEAFGSLGTIDCAKYLCTLYLQDISDFIRAVVSEHFEIIKYAEKISVAIPSFKMFEDVLFEPLNIIEREMLTLLDQQIERHSPEFIGFTIPFPGNLLAALRCAQHIKAKYPAIKTIAGGGYPTTELRSMTDKGVYKYFDYIILDDGETALERIINGGELVSTFSAKGFSPAVAEEKISHKERGCPDFSGLPFDKYFSLCEVTNPMHRLWSDGKWNKMMLAHGCYWAKCAFCDTSLDYIGCYDSVSASEFVDWMEAVAEQTGSRGFHFTDEAVPPKLLKEISLELIRRGLRYTWWTNIRFEGAFTGDLCRLMAAAGCIAVSGGLEVASDRLLKVMNKGVTIETATIAMRNLYYSGIMVHAYLMYGFPTQTLQETVDALEVVRQMFRAELIGSAFWHRYAMTVHSPSGLAPETFGVKRKNDHVNTFANNEIAFVEDRGYNIAAAGDALRTSLANYMLGSGIDKPAHKWFEGKAPHTTIENSEITDHLIKPDASRIFNENARLIWLGAAPVRTEEGILISTNSQQKEFKFAECDADFLIEIMRRCSDLSATVRFGKVKELYANYSEGLFATLYHSKKWDKLRELGLLQI